MKTKLLSLALASTLAVGACATQGGGTDNPWGSWGNKQTIGTAGGAVLGGVLGSKVGGGSGQLWATGAGALLGAFVGSSIGQSLDRADQAYHAQAVERAYSAPIGQTISWSNPESGHSGSVTPVREGRTGSGNICREYQQTIVIDGQAETANGTACREADGTWTLVN